MNEFSYLIADPSTGRSVIKQVLNQWKVPPARIRAMESLEHAKRELAAEIPNVAIVDGVLLDGSELVESYAKTRLEEAVPRILIVIAQRETKEYINAFFEDRIDGIILKPFTLQSLSEQLGAILRSKARPNPYEKALEVGRAFRRAGKAEKAEQVFGLAEKLNPAPALACWYRGDLARDAGDFERALAHFKRGISFQKDHFRSVEGAMDSCFRLGHDAAGALLAQFLLESKMLPAAGVAQWARAALRLERYEIGARAFDYLSVLHALSGDPARALVDTLIAYGKRELARDAKSAAAALRRAELCAQGDPELLARVVAALLRTEMFEEARALVGRVPPEVANHPDVRLAELWAVSRTAASLDVLQRALDLLKSGVRSPEIFKFAIEKSRELNRRPELIEDLVHEAQKMYPDSAEFSRN